MLVRLSNVIYWLCTAIAVGLPTSVMYTARDFTGPNWRVPVGTAFGIAIAVWLFGRATRYIVTGK